MRRVSRRDAIKLAGSAAVTTLAASQGCAPAQVRDSATEATVSEQTNLAASEPKQEQDAVVQTLPLSFPWQTRDPFLFCVHHDDAYPKGNAVMGPAASLEGRQLGMDFEGKDGWRMYHGDQVPGFPQHPHRGFETVTVVRRGMLDHSDSMGAAARYGGGDVQWLTAGAGILHSEMFPLLSDQKDNPVELFQIWLNLPSSHKMSKPYFSMLWDESVPKRTVRDANGRAVELTVVAGKYGEAAPPPPPPDSWASQDKSDVAIWTIKLSPGARFVVPRTALGTNRSLYFFRGGDLKIGGRGVPLQHRIDVKPELDVAIDNGSKESELLMLQGRPIGEPVAKHGPFVMNTMQEVQQAYMDYRQTQFGGWPWPSDEPVHAREEGRFARQPGGKVERPA
jgi:redox-sensitive bicupin YhaK (pirin superfamily)